MFEARIAGFGAWLAAAMLSMPVMAGSEHTRQHGAHEHGTAMLQVALEGRELQIELESPAVNIVGFEHQPRNPNEAQAVQQALASLRDAGRVFALPAGAKCTPGAVEIEGSLANARRGRSHGDGDEKGDKHGDDHSELHVRYRFACAQVDALREIEVKLFALFPRMERLRLELVGPKGQKATNLFRDRARIVF